MDNNNTIIIVLFLLSQRPESAALLITVVLKTLILRPKNAQCMRGPEMHAHNIMNITSLHRYGNHCPIFCRVSAGWRLFKTATLRKV